jgi:GT2 family glycosyltransferase
MGRVASLAHLEYSQIERTAGRMDNLGVVVLHWRNWPNVKQTLDAALSEGVDARRICIVDNASRDGSAEQIRSCYPECQVIELQENLGYGGGMNAGITALRVGDVLLLTHECVLQRGSLEALTARFEADSGLGAVGPLLVFSSRRDIVFSEGGELVGPRLLTQHISSGDALADHLDDEHRQVEWLDGACLLVRRKLFESVGLFDRGYFLYFEDADLLARARRHGWAIECEPRAVAIQEPGACSDALWVRNRLKFLAECGSYDALVRQLAHDARAALQLLFYRDAAHRRRSYLFMRGLLAPITRTSPQQLYELR